MFRTTVLLAALSAPALTLAVESSSFQMAEHRQVAREACGTNPADNCLAELKKVCHARLTFRCYYSRKDRLDAIREVGFPEDRARAYDE